MSDPGGIIPVEHINDPEGIIPVEHINDPGGIIHIEHIPLPYAPVFVDDDDANARSHFSLPLVSLQFRDVKINVQIEDS
jgi:hypothetical protein